MRAIYLPKFDEQSCKALIADNVALALLQSVALEAAAGEAGIKILICQDGRPLSSPAAATEEARMFLALFSYYMTEPSCSCRFAEQRFIFTDISFIDGRCVNISVEEIVQYHIIYYCGVWGGSGSALFDGLQGELAQAVKGQVQCGKLMWMGVCGGAMVSGARYEWTNRPGLDVLEGVTIDYCPNTSADDMGPSRTNRHRIHITSWCGVALWIDRDHTLASSFVVSKNGKWFGPKKEWADDNTQKLRDLVQVIGTEWHVCLDDEGNTWEWRLDGWMHLNGVVCEIPDM